MRRKNPPPFRESGVHMPEGIERIEEKSFRRTGKRFQINPVVGNFRVLASAGNSDLQLLTFALFPEPEFLGDQEKQFRQGASRSGGAFGVSECDGRATNRWQDQDRE